MVNPIRYTIDAVDPVTALQQGLGAGQQVRATEQQMQLASEFGQQRAAQEQRAAEMHPLQMQAAQQRIEAQRAASAQQLAQAQQKERYSAAMQQLYQLGTGATFEDATSIAAEFPQFGVAVMEGWQGLSEEVKRGTSLTLAQIGSAIKSGNVALAEELAEGYAAGAEANGDDAGAATARAMIAQMAVDPSAAYASLASYLAVVAPAAAKSLLGDARVQTSTPLYSGGAEMVLSDGSVRVVTAGNQILTGAEAEKYVEDSRQAEIDAAGATTAAREEGKLTTQADLGGEAAAAKRAGTIAQDLSLELFEKMGAVSGSVATMQEAIDAIDAGAQTGPVANWLPNVTTASVELENAMNRMGLDVISSVTFGALSEGEMKMALNTAAPRNLKPEALRAWLVEKQQAQTKAREALQSAALYLSKPGNTLSGWMEQSAAQDAEPAGAAAPTLEDFRQYVKPGTSDADIQRFMGINARAARGQRPTPDERAFLQGIKR